MIKLSSSYQTNLHEIIRSIVNNTAKTDSIHALILKCYYNKCPMNNPSRKCIKVSIEDGIYLFHNQCFDRFVSPYN